MFLSNTSFLYDFVPARRIVGEHLSRLQDADIEADKARRGPSAQIPVTAGRDPRSAVIGYLETGMLVRLAVVVGTRACLAYVVDGSHQEMWGGWFPFLHLNGRPTLMRILEETENMREARRAQEYLEQAMALGDEAAQDGEIKFPWHEEEEEVELVPPIIHESVPPPDGTRVAKPPLVYAEQRQTITGGWRQVLDPIWGKLMYIQPISGIATWGLNDVMKSGGMDDLLLNRSWEICIVDPVAVEVMKDRDWSFKVYSDKGLTHPPVQHLQKGDFFIGVQFDEYEQIVTLLIPPADKDGAYGFGYARSRLQDGRALIRAMIQPVDGTPAGHGAEPPEDLVIEGPFFSRPAGDAAENLVSVGQDVDSAAWARLPRNYRVGGFAEILGMRGRLPELEGSGWVSLFRRDGTPNFWKKPIVPPKMELPPDTEGAEKAAREARIKAARKVSAKRTNAVGGAGAGVASIAELEDDGEGEAGGPEFPMVLEKLGAGRMACDWVRAHYPMLGGVIKGDKVGRGGNKFIYKSPFTPAHTTLDQLIKLGIWKATMVDVAELVLREGPQMDSPPVMTVTRGCILITEWISPLMAVRVLLPAEPDDEQPRHVWADLGGREGTVLVPLPETGEFWVEPRGGHLAEELQRDPDENNMVTLPVRCELDPLSPERKNQYLQRGDAIEFAEVVGRRARVIQTGYINLDYTAPDGGWIDLFDEAGWCQLKRRFGDEKHIIQLQREERDREIFKAKLAQEAKSRASSRQSTARLSTAAARRSSSRGEPVSPAKLAEALEKKAKAKDMEAAGSDGFSALTDGTEELTLAEVPLLLQQLGELEAASVLTRDWREHRDPIWGRRYFVNRWSGQVIHRLKSMGVARCMVRLTIWFHNLSLPYAEETLGHNIYPKRKKDLEGSMKECILSMADVPDDFVEVRFEDGPGIAAEKSGDKPGTMSARAKDKIEDEGPQMRVIADIKAPGIHASWASAGLKRAMADGESFSYNMFGFVCNIPQIQCLIPDVQTMSLGFLRADLEELDVPQLPPFLEPKPPPTPPLPPAEDQIVKEIRRQLPYARPKVLEHPYTCFKGENGHALAEGLRHALEDGGPHLLEIHLWCCQLGDEGAAALAGALNNGCGVQLHTVLLDENEIGPLGATALGAALRNCKFMREVNLSRNPIESAGFRNLVGGLGSGMSVLDVSHGALSDPACKGVAACLRRWPKCCSLKLGGNPGITSKGAEVLARSLLVLPELKSIDLKGSSLGNEAPRLKRLVESGGVDVTRFRL
eukprot:TRINITY_DN14961_c0_g3_i2.p1 TRINITY_DN14961_c0_g3~~TRINITY_DN14961_c0_g3_i2.p1  ORF type:complete len:1263 (+),score=261.12 TRINITY_DN14961_c0_g3_i2:106-3894(+)